jgi:hypothetical protein
MLGDFYKAWMKCKIFISEIKTSFSGTFLKYDGEERANVIGK